MEALLLLVLLVGIIIHARELNQVWQITSFAQRNTALKQEYALEVNFAALASFFTPPSSTAAARHPRASEEILSFVIPQFGTQRCTLSSSKLFAPKLAAKHPDLVLRTGDCNNGTMQMFLNLDLTTHTSFSATFTIPGRQSDWFYIDNSHGNQYVLYSKSSKKSGDGAPKFACEAREAPHAAHESTERLLLSSTERAVGNTFRLAIVANADYVKITGGRKKSALNAIAAVMSRVNGIYMRELGVYFQLIDNTDELFCVAKSNMANCAKLPNVDATTVLQNAKQFIKSRGVATSEYDIGHVVTTGSGGLAAVAVLCGPNKAEGTTGMHTPFGDAFSVDYVAHELGHQLSGLHSFRYCDGRNAVQEAAVEPGGGSSIMAYAGICNTNNIQLYSDPYFHPINLPVMTNFVAHQVRTVKNCGLPADATTATARRMRPTITTSAVASATCSVPLGSYFALRAQASNNTKYFQWDHIDASVQQLQDMMVPRFRSWKPRTVTERYFPNLYYLTHGLQDAAQYRRMENLPSKPATLTFRFVARTLYDTNANNGEESNALLGDFVYRDFRIAFVDTMVPFRFAEETREMLQKQAVRAGEPVHLYWNKNGADAAARVEILIAVNPMDRQDVVPIETFDAETHLLDLNWISLGVFPNEGSAVVVVSLAGYVSYMIRPVYTGVCTAFDFIPHGIVLPTLVHTQQPTTLQPTLEPTTAYPTKRLTLKPSLRPSTAFPSKRPSRVPTVAPTAGKGAYLVHLPSSTTISAVVHEMYECDETLCDYVAPIGFACSLNSPVVGYVYTAPARAVYVFTTANALSTTCKDTTLYAKEFALCNNDVTRNRNAKSKLKLTLDANQTVHLYVGSLGNKCTVGSTVSLAVSAKPTSKPTPRRPTKRPNKKMTAQ